MTDNVKRFFKEIKDNAALRADLEELNREFKGNEKAVDEIKPRVVAIAKTHGFNLEEDDLVWAGSDEITDEEISSVAGGYTNCGCFGAGAGAGSDNDGETTGCACVAYGQGGDAHDDNTECICIAYGTGE